MTEHRHLLMTMTACSTATAALLLASPAAAQAAPDKATTTEVRAPYAGAATFRGSTDCAEPGAVCQTSGTADATTGRSTVTGSYHRGAPASGSGSVFGRAWQEVSYAVPRGAKTVTAVLTYRVDSASAAAAASVGWVDAVSGLAAWFVYDSCASPGCQSTSQQRQLASTRGPYGLPGPPQRVTGPRTETLTLTATGSLPRTLLLTANTYVIINGSGEYSVCLNWDGCSGPSVTAHSGTADAHVDATLLSVVFSSS